MFNDLLELINCRFHHNCHPKMLYNVRHNVEKLASLTPEMIITSSNLMTKRKKYFTRPMINMSNIPKRKHSWFIVSIHLNKMIHGKVSHDNASLLFI